MYYVQGSYKFRNHPHRELWIYGDDDQYMYYCSDGLNQRKAKLRYREPTGWGCEKYGLYFIAKFPDGGRKNIWLKDLVEYR